MRHERAIAAIQSAIRSIDTYINREQDDINRWSTVVDPPSAVENAERSIVRAESRIEGFKKDKEALQESLRVLERDQSSLAA